MVYLKASARGLPVIAGRAGGAVDAVDDGVTGLLIDPESPRRLLMPYCDFSPITTGRGYSDRQVSSGRRTSPGR